MDENQNNYSGGDGQNNNQNGYSYGESRNNNQNGYSYGESQNNNQSGYSYGESQNNNQSGYSYGESQNNNQSGYSYGENQNNNQNGYSYNENQNNNQGNYVYNANQSNYQYGGGEYPQYEEKPAGNRGMAIGSLVVGIFAIFCCCCGPLSVILGIVGILLAIFSKPKGGKMEAVAIGGLSCSIVGLVLCVFIMITSCFQMNSPEYVEFMDEYMEYMMEEMYE